VAAGAGPRFSPTGHLLYVSGGRLHAVAFDPETLETRGDPAVVLDQEIVHTNFDLCENGTLVYQPVSTAWGEAPETLVWIDRDGRQEPLSAPIPAWFYPRISRMGGAWWRIGSPRKAATPTSTSGTSNGGLRVD
jgi:hypothetical protein